MPLVAQQPFGKQIKLCELLEKVLHRYCSSQKIAIVTEGWLLLELVLEENSETAKMTLENLFLTLNLGCEMIYVIDQRLNAQSVALDKSATVLRDLTEVLLDHKFLNYITTSYENRMLTLHQARILLTVSS